MRAKTHYTIVPRVLDLFSGAGGTGLGFARAGFRIVAAIENNPNAAATYRYNLGVDVIEEDITTIDPADLRAKLALEKGELEVVVGCPPCQGFSKMRNANGEGDGRNDLVLLYLDFIDEFRPRFALFENVSGILGTGHGRSFFDRLCAGLKEMDYALTVREVDVADYGVPQHRKRVIVIAMTGQESPRFPHPTHGAPNSASVKNGTLLPWLTVRDAIGNGRYPEIGQGESSVVANHVAPRTGERVLAFIRQVPLDGGSRTDVPKTLWLPCHIGHNGHRDVYGRLRWDRPSGTITSGCTNPSRGRFVHPEADRALTPREAAALQGFPDDFVFVGTDIPTQIGNAVPPPLAESLARTLADLNEG